MKEGWREVRLGELIVLHDAKRIPLSSRERQQRKGIYPYYGATGVIDHVDDYLFDGDYILLGEDGSVITEHNKPIVQYVSGKIWVNNHAHVITASNLVDFRFLYFLLANLNIRPAVTGAVQLKVSQANLVSLSAVLPPLPIQRRIAAVLGALDDKIELNRKMNATLEEMAQALFRHWFVDFGPWGGKRPKGWKDTALKELADFTNGYSYTSDELGDSQYAMATIKNFERGGGFKLDGYKEILPSAKLKEEQKVGMFDILVAHTDLTQKAEVIGNAEMILSKMGYETLIMSSDLVKVIPKKGVSRFILAGVLKYTGFKAYAHGYVNGTTVLHMRRNALPEFMFPYPSDPKTLRPLAVWSEAICRRMAINYESSRALAAMRDALLPKLMKGEIEVA